MKSIKFYLLLVFLILFSLSCAALSQSVTNGFGFGGATTGFFAEAPPYGSVKLKWDAVEGADIYLLEHRLDGQENLFPRNGIKCGSNRLRRLHGSEGQQADVSPANLYGWQTGRIQYSQCDHSGCPAESADGAGDLCRRSNGDPIHRPRWRKHEPDGSERGAL